jgi:hypothetical protein
MKGPKGPQQFVPLWELMIPRSTPQNSAKTPKTRLSPEQYWAMLGGAEGEGEQREEAAWALLFPQRDSQLPQ